MDDLGNAIAAPTPEEKLAWESELAKVEEEIRTLRQVRENYLMTFLKGLGVEIATLVRKNFRHFINFAYFDLISVLF